jgi:hypothetical protein
MFSETGSPARRWLSPVRLGRMIKKEFKQLLRDPKARPIVFVAPSWKRTCPPATSR